MSTPEENAGIDAPPAEEPAHRYLLEAASRWQRQAYEAGVRDTEARLRANIAAADAETRAAQTTPVASNPTNPIAELTELVRRRTDYTRDEFWGMAGALVDGARAALNREHGSTPPQDTPAPERLSAEDRIRRRILAAWGPDVDEQRDVLTIGPIGSRNDTLIYNRRNGECITGVNGGYAPCFRGSIGDMTTKVEMTYERGTKHSDDYLAALRFLDDVQKADRRRERESHEALDPNMPVLDGAYALADLPMPPDAWMDRWGHDAVCPRSSCDLLITAHSEAAWRRHTSAAVEVTR